MCVCGGHSLHGAGSSVWDEEERETLSMILLHAFTYRGIESQVMVMNDWKKMTNPTYEEVITTRQQ